MHAEKHNQRQQHTFFYALTTASQKFDTPGFSASNKFDTPGVFLETASVIKSYSPVSIISPLGFLPSRVLIDQFDIPNPSNKWWVGGGWVVDVVGFW